MNTQTQAQADFVRSLLNTVEAGENAQSVIHDIFERIVVEFQALIKAKTIPVDVVKELYPFGLTRWGFSSYRFEGVNVHITCSECFRGETDHAWDTFPSAILFMDPPSRSEAIKALVDERLFAWESKAKLAAAEEEHEARRQLEELKKRFKE